MALAAAALLLALTAGPAVGQPLGSRKNAPCSSKDNKDDWCALLPAMLPHLTHATPHSWRCCCAHRSKALVDLAASTHLAGWKSKKNWLKDVSVCEWYGVTCKKGDVTDKKTGRVTGLALKSNGLAGSLPVRPLHRYFPYFPYTPPFND